LFFIRRFFNPAETFGMRSAKILSSRRLLRIEDKLVAKGIAKDKKPVVAAKYHSPLQTCDKRIVYVTNTIFSIYLNF